MSILPPRDVRVEWNMDVASWNHALSACPDATFFHTQAWLGAVSGTFETAIARVRLVLPDGRWALLPLSVRRLAKGWLPLAIAGETGAYSGLIAPEPLTLPEAELCYQAILARYPDLQITGNPFALGAHLPARTRQGQRVQQHTHLLELRPPELLRQGFSRGCKARGNKARRHGLALRVSQAPEDARIFYQLYLDSMRRWGDRLTWARPLAFFEDMLREGRPQVQLFLAYDGARPIAGLLMAAYGEAVHYLAGATDTESMASCPSNFLMEEAMAHYHAAGVRFFDFGPSNGLAGVIQFKESFGAKPVPFFAQRHQSPGGQAYFALRQARDRASGMAERAQEALQFRRPSQVRRSVSSPI